MCTTIVLKDQRYLNHITRFGHPESPQRLEAIYASLLDDDIKGTFREVAPRPATRQEIAGNHSESYIERVAQTAEKSFVSLDPDTSTSEGSWEASVLAAGAVVTGIDFIMAGDATNAFALVRPPGHHAERARAMGFCLFNNIAIGARYLISKHGLERILIVDWDIHHGNGTQKAFYTSPEVLYFSTHQFPYYPGTGSLEEIGEQQGAGFTVNVPLGGGQGDEDFLKIYTELLRPLSEQYRPQFILVSAGYDIYGRDPLGTMNVSPYGFFLMTRFIKQMADDLCEGRLLLALEGGYHVEGIAESVKQTLAGLTGSTGRGVSAPEKGSSYGSVSDTIKRVKGIHSRYWKL